MATLANDDVVSNEGRDIFIVNAGFEDEALLNDAAWTYGAPGWVLSDVGGDYNPSPAQNTDEAYEGSNAGWLTSGAASNTLSETYSSNQNYVLSVAVAGRLDLADPQVGYIIR
uniref:hypothetical protein n=1 Tax=Lentilitoribacter sp. Alg239-R112 TaxID=2305987 RepID=UPI0013A6CE78